MLLINPATNISDSKVHDAYMGPGGPHVDPMVLVTMAASPVLMIDGRAINDYTF